MKLQRREKILAGVALGLVGLGGAWFLLFAGDERTHEQLTATEAKLTDENETKQRLLQTADAERERAREDAQRPARRYRAGPHALSRVAAAAGGTGRVSRNQAFGLRGRGPPRAGDADFDDAQLPDDARRTGAVPLRVLFRRLPAADPADGREVRPQRKRAGCEPGDRCLLSDRGGGE